eukprot:COSAG05_NODE_3142_length_2290_cov_1.530351_2_plen_377_part_00
MGNRKHKKKRKSKSKSKAIDLTLRLNVELQQGPSKARVKRIGSRKRPNLRTMRNGMGGLTPANLKQPSFFGNTNLLTNAAMAAMNNKAYALERQMLDNQAEVKALQNRGGNTESLQRENELLQQQLQLTRGLGQAAVLTGQQQVALTQGEQATAAQTQKADKREIAKSLSKQEIVKRVAKATGVAVTDVNLPARLSKEQKGEIQDLIEDNNVEGLRALMGSPPQTPQPLGTPSSPPYAPPLTVDQQRTPSAQEILDRKRSESRKYTNPLNEFDEDESGLTTGTSPPFSFDLSEVDQEVSTDNPLDVDVSQQEISDAAARVQQGLQSILEKTSAVKVNRRRQGDIGSLIPSSSAEQSTFYPESGEEGDIDAYDPDNE